MNQTRLALLKLIEANDGQLSWYQLDRTISSSGTERDEGLMQSLRALESEGLIERRVGVNPSQPKYAITSNGSELLASVSDRPSS